MKTALTDAYASKEAGMRGKAPQQVAALRLSHDKALQGYFCWLDPEAALLSDAPCEPLVPELLPGAPCALGVVELPTEELP
jgi:hypothetical protein